MGYIPSPMKVFYRKLSPAYLTHSQLAINLQIARTFHSQDVFKRSRNSCLHRDVCAHKAWAQSLVSHEPIFVTYVYTQHSGKGGRRIRISRLPECNGTFL